MTQKTNKTAKKSRKKSEKNPKKKGVSHANNAQKTVKKAQRKPQAGKKTRIDDVENHVAVAQAAFREITPPDHIKLKKFEWPFWDSIIEEFAIYDWTNHTLELAALLARNMYAYEKAQRKLARQGELLERKQIIPAKGDEPAKVIVTGTYANPLKGFIKTYHENILSMRRSLAMHARGKDGEKRDIDKRRGAAKDIQNDILDDDDDLLAKPITVQ